MIFLKIVGIILLILLYILIFLLVIIAYALLSRIMYDIRFEKSEKFSIFIKARWLTGILRLKYCRTEGDNELDFRFLWIKLNKQIKNDSEKPSKELEKEKIKEEKRGAEKKSDVNVGKNLKDREDASEKSTQKELSGEAAGFSEKFDDITTRIRQFLDYQDKAKIYEYTKKLLVRLLKALKPRIFKLNALIGFEDPALTGKIIGLAYALTGAAGLEAHIDGDFEKPGFSAGGYINGSTSLFALGFPLVVFALKKPIRKIIIDKFFKKGEKHEHSNDK